MYPTAIALILFVALTCFAYSLYRRFTLLKVARGFDNRLENPGERLKAVLEFAIGQKRLLFRDTKSGLMHALIFWGFCVLSLRTITFFGLGFRDNFVLPGLHGALGTAYNFTYNLFLILVTLACVYGLYRRLVIKPKRLTASVEAIVILCVILGLCFTDFLFAGAGPRASRARS